MYMTDDDADNDAAAAAAAADDDDDDDAGIEEESVEWICPTPSPPDDCGSEDSDDDSNWLARFKLQTLHTQWTDFEYFIGLLYAVAISVENFPKILYCPKFPEISAKARKPPSAVLLWTCLAFCCMIKQDYIEKNACTSIWEMNKWSKWAFATWWGIRW